jgi:uncharacterized protein YdgA (DUF945 family)
VGKQAISALVVVAIVVAAAPPLFGIAYEQQIRSQVAGAPVNPYLSFELAEYERGLYSSQGVLRLALSDEYLEQLHSMFETRNPDSAPTAEQQAMIDKLLDVMSAELRFDIDVQHGPANAAEGVHLGLASVHTEVDSTAGTLAEIQQQLDVPYLFRADAQVDFDGSFDFQAAIPPLVKRDPDYSFEFSGLEYNGHFDRADTSVQATGETDLFLLETAGAEIVVEDIGAVIDARLLSSYLWLGKTSLDIREVRVGNSGATAGPTFGMLGLGMDADVAMNETADKLTMAFEYRMAGITGLPDSDVADLNVGMRLRNIDRDAIEDYVQLAQQFGLASADAMEKFIPKLQAIGIRILRASPGFDLSPVQFTLNGEPFTASVGIDFDGAAVPADIDIVTLDSAPGLLLGALSATGQIESSDSLTRTLAINILRGQIAQSVPPDAQITAADIDAAASQQAAMMIDGMIQQGLIQRKNGQLNMDFSYADGQLFVNNVPIPFGQP